MNAPILRPYPIPGRWLESAACADVDPRLFYTRNTLTAAAAVCAGCLVAAECLDYALACEDLDPYGGHGMWAGISGPARNRLRKQINLDTQEAS